MRMEVKPWAGGFLAALLWLALWAWLMATLGCMRYAAGRDASVALESAVRITGVCVGDGEVRAMVGSGVIVSNRVLLTAAHVATPPDGLFCSYSASMVNGKIYDVRPKRVVEPLDLATMEVVDEPFSPTYPVIYGPKPGYATRVCSMTGYPAFVWRCGDVQLSSSPPGDLSHTILVEGGNSGSGVYDTHGRLVGIITHRWMCNNGQLCGGKMATLEGRQHVLGL